MFCLYFEDSVFWVFLDFESFQPWNFGLQQINLFLRFLSLGGRVGFVLWGTDNKEGGGLVLMCLQEKTGQLESGCWVWWE